MMWFSRAKRSVGWLTSRPMMSKSSKPRRARAMEPPIRPSPTITICLFIVTPMRLPAR